MKLISRKALAAIATTFALTTAGVSAPAFAEETPAVSQDTLGSQQTSGDDNDDDTKDEADEKNEDLSSGSSTTVDEDGNEVEGASSNPKEIRDWVAVFTAVVGALSTAFVFIQKMNV